MPDSIIDFQQSEDAPPVLPENPDPNLWTAVQQSRLDPETGHRTYSANYARRAIAPPAGMSGGVTMPDINAIYKNASALYPKIADAEKAVEMALKQQGLIGYNKMYSSLTAAGYDPQIAASKALTEYGRYFLKDLGASQIHAQQAQQATLDREQQMEALRDKNARARWEYQHPANEWKPSSDIGKLEQDIKHYRETGDEAAAAALEAVATERGRSKAKKENQGLVIPPGATGATAPVNAPYGGPGAGLLRGIRNFFSGPDESTIPPIGSVSSFGPVSTGPATPSLAAQKAAMATALSAEHPDWDRDRILQEIKAQFDSQQ